MKIIIIQSKDWSKGKGNPTEFNYSDNSIYVNNSYDIKNDPCGWLVHEKVHFNERNKNLNRDNYPDCDNEINPYIEQFQYLKNKGYSFDNIFNLQDMKSIIKYKDILKKYWI